MAKYIALLRGVNVGQNVLKMDRLRALCAQLGFKNVSTYVQSGNILFDADAPPSDCARALEQKLARETRLPVAVLVRTAGEFKTLIARNPFLKDKAVDRTRLHVTFLHGSPAGRRTGPPAGRRTGEPASEKESLSKLNAISAGADQFRLAGKEVYLYCPDGYGRSKLSNNALERALGVIATTRNWNTVTRLFEIASQ